MALTYVDYDLWPSPAKQRFDRAGYGVYCANHTIMRDYGSPKPDQDLVGGEIRLPIQEFPTLSVGNLISDGLDGTSFDPNDADDSIYNFYD